MTGLAHRDRSPVDPGEKVGRDIDIGPDTLVTSGGDFEIGMEFQGNRDLRIILVVIRTIGPGSESHSVPAPGTPHPLGNVPFIVIFVREAAQSLDLEIADIKELDLIVFFHPAGLTGSGRRAILFAGKKIGTQSTGGNRRRMKERRRHLRINKSLFLTYRSLRDYLTSSSKSVDVSPGGIRFPVRRRLEAGTVLKMEIHSRKPGRVIPLTGTVVWVNEVTGGRFPFEVGVRFLEISPADLDTLHRICERSEKKPDRIRWMG